MVRGEQIPKPILEIIIAPLDKPGRSPNARDAKRPISLINTIMKIDEIVVYNRRIIAMESAMHPAQHAYRRNRGAETHLAAPRGTIQEAVDKDCYVYLASLAIGAALDTVSHEHLATAFRALHIDEHCARFVEFWLKNRTFRVRIQTENGPVRSGPKTISRGLPQGGVLSPMLWNLFFNNVHHSLTSEFAQRDFVKQRKIHLYIDIYADDIAIVLIHPDPKILQHAAVLLMLKFPQNRKTSERNQNPSLKETSYLPPEQKIATNK